MLLARLALVGDFSPDITAHRAIETSLELAKAKFSIDATWLHTTSIRPGLSLAGFSGIWCVPNSPYAHTAGALWAIEWARTTGTPFLGTCGGFQHALLEFVRGVLGREAAHAELDPAAPSPLVSKLACPLVEQSERIEPTGRGRFAKWYGAARAEDFCCSYGLNPAFESLLESSALQVVARGASGQVRAVELRGHPFFVGTLFQPERAGLSGELHPLIAAFLEAISRRSQSHGIPR
jgi:CTP synthase (UTP-ammonia lyase)